MSQVISVRFRGGGKAYYFDPRNLPVRTGQDVIVSTAMGVEYGTCTQGVHEVPEGAITKPLSPVLRIATDADRRTVEYHRRREKEAFGIAEQKIADHGLEMKLVNVSTSFEGNKIVFYFTADGRVDFRALVRDLASVFRSRIELRQIGVRDEARMIGGIGICGRPFCCSQFLDTFLPVSIKMAKTQNLSLNPSKISGTCGRLMCCLKYEQHAYEDAARRLPRVDSFVQTPDGPGTVRGVDLLRETVKVSLDSEPEPLKSYHHDEIILLRSGKGNREGIRIPPPPERRVVERKEELFEPPFPEVYEAHEREAPVRARTPAAPETDLSYPDYEQEGTRIHFAKENRRGKQDQKRENIAKAGGGQKREFQKRENPKREYGDGGDARRRSRNYYRSGRRGKGGRSDWNGK